MPNRSQSALELSRWKNERSWLLIEKINTNSVVEGSKNSITMCSPIAIDKIKITKQKLMKQSNCLRDIDNDIKVVEWLDYITKFYLRNFVFTFFWKWTQLAL